MNNRVMLAIVIVTLIVASASLTQTFLLTTAVTDQNSHIDQLASQLGSLAGVVSSLMTSTQSSPTPQSNNVVYLEVVPDFGGSTYDAFVVPTSLGGSTPNASSTATAAPNNNITVPHDVPIKFVIINIDTAVNENFTGQVSVPFTLY
ncbi:MAG TPA: hypothetical protein VE862_11335, partial [Candidatus Acidoferrum sp.]|nr:hypothetical protein [Candidatus Acidoferrum sp.]